MKYHVARDGQPIGILLEYEVRDGLKSGELRGTDLYWREGMAEWLPLSSASDVADALVADRSPYAAPGAEIESPTDDAAAGRASLATLNERFRAFLFDLSLASMCLLSLSQGERMIRESGVADAFSSALIFLGGFGALVLFIWNVVLLWTQGQTLGKRWMNIRIAKIEDDSAPGFVRVILLRTALNGLPGFIPFVGLVYAVTDAAFIFRPDRRCIHDLIARTHVVKGSLPKR